MTCSVVSTAVDGDSGTPRELIPPPEPPKVRGLLNKEEIVMAKGTDYLAGTHVVVTTPAALMEVYTGEGRK